jgi:dephospho-CoA kinase
MLKVGLTGNIGSGKTFVASIFGTLGVPVFVADTEAKKLYDREEIRMMLRGLFGGRIFNEDGSIDKKSLASEVFNNPENLQRLSQVIHPMVRETFGRWSLERSNSPYVLYEAAILFESGYYKDLDKIILVMAPEEIRVKRVMERDGASRDEVLSRMTNQWQEDKKVSMADFIINNNGSEMVIPQVLEVHRRIMLELGSRDFGTRPPSM